MRFGERLIHDQIITAEQLDEGVRAQVLQGGRLGTNLVELGYLDIDTLGEYLGRYHGMPVALDRHFEVASPLLQARLSPDLAQKWGVVPIGRLLGSQDDNPHIAVAVMDPLPEQAIEEISAALGGQIVLTITPEIRLRYQLERAYAIPRSNRFHVPDSLPGIAAPSDDDAQCDIVIHIHGDEIDAPKLENLAIDEMADSDVAETAAPHGAAAGPGQASAPAQPEGRDGDQRDDSDDSAAATAQLARIAIKRVSNPVAPTMAVDPKAPPAPATLDEFVRAIRRARGRDTVGDLVVNALRDLFEGVFAVGAILVVRDGIAMGWKGFVRHGRDELVEALAVPLGTPSVVFEAYRTGEPRLGPPAEGGSDLDRRLWALLKCQPPETVAVTPVMLDSRAVCLLYAHSQTPTEQATPLIGDGLATLAQATGKAFIRLIRAAQR